VVTHHGTPLIGHPEGDCFSYTLSPAEAYGDRNPDLIQRVSRNMLNEYTEPDTILLQAIWLSSQRLMVVVIRVY